MRMFTPEMNAVLLRHAMAGAIRLRGGSRQVDLAEFPEDKKAFCLAAIKDLELESATALTVDAWYNKHWQLFPFGDTWGPLPKTHRQIIATAYTQCRSMSALYGEEV